MTDFEVRTSLLQFSTKGTRHSVDTEVGSSSDYSNPSVHEVNLSKTGK